MVVTSDSDLGDDLERMSEARLPHLTKQQVRLLSDRERWW